MHLTTITIGRNVKETPMTIERWLRFQVAIENLIELCLFSETTLRFEGVGEWQGVKEDSVTYHVLSETALDESQQEAFGQVLSANAARFDQDAIAWSHSVSHLAER